MWIIPSFGRFENSRPLYIAEWGFFFFFLMEKLNKTWQEKELARPSILFPPLFSVPFFQVIKIPSLKKEKGHRMTGCELAEKEGALERRESRRLVN